MKPHAASKTRRAVSKSLKSVAPAEPMRERDVLFCKAYVKSGDHNKAWVEAGFTKLSNSSFYALRKVQKFRGYIDRLSAKVEVHVAKKISYERTDILAGIAAIGYCNALDYVKVVDGQLALKPMTELTREQAAAIDSLSYDGTTVTYTLPRAKTRLSALTTLGEQAANFKKPAATHNHLHVDVPLEKLRELKAQFAAALGPQVTREILGFTEEEQQQ
jgi:hypothetical protein